MAVGIVNNTIKRQRSRSMEMRYFWLLDQQTQKYLAVYYHPGQENMGDYPSKHHFSPGHKHVRPWYVHMPNSPTHLPRAVKPSSRRGCAEILGDPYHKMVPLPRIPNYRDLGRRPNPLSVHKPSSAERTRQARLTSMLNEHTKIMTPQ